MTRDADLKVLVERDDAERLLAVLAADYTSLPPDMRHALARQGVIFVQDTLGTRLDLLLPIHPMTLSPSNADATLNCNPV